MYLVRKYVGCRAIPNNIVSVAQAFEKIWSIETRTEIKRLLIEQIIGDLAERYLILNVWACVPLEDTRFARAVQDARTKIVSNQAI